MRIIYCLLALAVVANTTSAQAQMAASKNAQYLATITAVSAYKINDEENLREVQSLRENKRFNDQLQRMMAKLQNTRTKDSNNKKIQAILEKAGKDIYDILK